MQFDITPFHSVDSSWLAKPLQSGTNYSSNASVISTPRSSEVTASWVNIGPPLPKWNSDTMVVPTSPSAATSCQQPALLLLASLLIVSSNPLRLSVLFLLRSHSRLCAFRQMFSRHDDLLRTKGDFHPSHPPHSSHYSTSRLSGLQYPRIWREKRATCETGCGGGSGEVGARAAGVPRNGCLVPHCLSTATPHNASVMPPHLSLQSGPLISSSSSRATFVRFVETSRRFLLSLRPRQPQL